MGRTDIIEDRKSSARSQQVENALTTLYNIGLERGRFIDPSRFLILSRTTSHRVSLRTKVERESRIEG